MLKHDISREGKILPSYKAKSAEAPAQMSDSQTSSSVATEENMDLLGASSSNDIQPTVQREFISWSDSDNEPASDETYLGCNKSVSLRNQSLDDQNFLALCANFVFNN